MRYRTMIGSALILVFLLFWIGLAGWIGTVIPKNQLLQLIYFVIAGVGWGLPVIPLMRWMARDP